MRQVIVTNPQNDSLVAQLLSLHQVFQGVLPEEKLNFNLSSLNWVCPLLVLTLSAYINDTESEFTTDEFCEIKSYLNTIKFPKGVNSISSFQQQIQQGKNYIPISVLEKEAREARERLESLFSQMVWRLLKAISGAEGAIYYPITELVNNIFEHSKRDKGFIFGQFYPKKNYLDICIVDRGRGLKATYKDEKGLNLSDEEAIIEVMKGTSTKIGKERGYGVWTSKNVICNGLGGEFLLLSGTEALVSIKGEEMLVPLPNFDWQGVVISYRIPVPKTPIDIYPYIE